MHVDQCEYVSDIPSVQTPPYKTDGQQIVEMNAHRVGMYWVDLGAKIVDNRKILEVKFLELFTAVKERLKVSTLNVTHQFQSRKKNICKWITQSISN